MIDAIGNDDGVAQRPPIMPSQIVVHRSRGRDDAAAAASPRTTCRRYSSHSGGRRACHAPPCHQDNTSEWATTTTGQVAAEPGLRKAVDMHKVDGLPPGERGEPTAAGGNVALAAPAIHSRRKSLSRQGDVANAGRRAARCSGCAARARASPKRNRIASQGRAQPQRIIPHAADRVGGHQDRRHAPVTARAVSSSLQPQGPRSWMSLNAAWRSR